MTTGQLVTGILVALDVLPPPSASPSSTAVYPIGTHGFAAYIVGGFFAIGLLMLVMLILGRRPKRPPSDPIPRPR